MDTVKEATLEGAPNGHCARLLIPLNSKRLTAAHLKRLATALDIPTTAAGDEVRQMVEGKLGEQGREPRNVQVVLGAMPRDSFSLRDAEGTFLTVDAEEEARAEDAPEPSNSESEGSGGELDGLRAELLTVKAENKELRQQVEQQKARVRELGRLTAYAWQSTMS